MLDVVVSHLDENEPPPLSFADSPLSVRPGRATVPEVASEPPPSARTLDARDRAKEPPRSRASASPLRKVSVNFRAPTQRGEKAEELSLPEGRESDRPRPFDDLPKTVLGARIGFTHMSRELGRLYRTRRNVVLYADMGGVADMQEYLDQRFFRPRSLKREEQVEIWMHGAFLSEILARMLGGFWLDIAPSEIGYWEMRLPSNVRAWPFGRVMRFVMQADEGRTLTDYVEALRLCTEV